MGIAGTLLVVPALAAGCSDAESEADGPSVVVTTNILGDVTRTLVGEGGAQVETIMPPGSDPHEFEASSRQAETMLDADLLVVNGAGFESGLEGLIDQAEDAGVEVFVVADHVSLLSGDGEDEGHEDEGHEDEEHAAGEDEGHEDEEHAAGEDEGHEDEEHAAEEDEHDHGSDDPHVWTDPTRMVGAVEELRDELLELDGIDRDLIDEQVDAYVDQLTALDAEIEQALEPVPDDQRVLVTNHEVFGYFADRYGFEVVGTVIPSTSTLAEPSAAELEDLADVLEEHQVPAIFAETSNSSELAANLARSVGDVEVVELYSESLGEEGSGAETYVDMMRTNATRIAEALS